MNTSELEMEIENYENGKDDIARNRHQEKKSSSIKRFVNLTVTAQTISARALSVNTDAKTSKFIIGSMSVTANLKEFILTDLERATSNFEEVLGKGSSGKVFKGWVHENTYAPSTPNIGLPIAVKRFIPERTQGHAEWQMEIDLLRECNHPNLVKLLGYCSEGREHFLVYEYMQNRDLDTHIFKWEIYQKLHWEVRLKILIGAARCLAFFHTAKQIVVCRDLKTSRILLDENFNAKLSPHQLTRLSLSSKDTDVTTRSAATLCYAAPEYVKSGIISLETDVYAFGVVLMEIMTGIRADEMLHFTDSITYYNDKEKRLVHYATSLNTYLDPWLDDNFPGGARSQLFAFIASLITKCVDSSPSNRPSMSEVVESLELIAVEFI
ncbi:serine/threonine-protein kinase PCRK1 [Heracleum sosnowskyi]|uniref:Serine/threonine-protein kinase PCRK1 n=1 Tax=Heracleum sosnowskyi TaxID=360622 RepID=A0AAD8MWM4_9APIA|nr:serine/threonine-protein kinase PCRK1 [Heracleum sosnowskyi]